ncbi:MAG TPA: hypothetical protein DDW65_15720 [Firmicutes bacterium]|jgi:uncharacterized protein YlxW (UPF0749 family)|nr:hypothetical protein [Bacillota bacterium]
MVEIRSWQVGIAIVSMMLGLILVFQLRTEWRISTTLPTRQVNELAKIYGSQKMQLEKYKQENEYLHKQLKDYDRDQEIVRLRMATGLVPLRGQGIFITLTNYDKKLDNYEDPNFYIVHYYQLDLLINELWAAGAEAIAVNKNRIINTSGFSCAGTTLLVDAKRLAPPYEISAIGNPANLKKAITLPGGYVEQEILAFNLKFSMETVDRIEIPAYKGAISYEYARAVKERK